MYGSTAKLNWGRLVPRCELLLIQCRAMVKLAPRVAAAAASGLAAYLLGQLHDGTGPWILPKARSLLRRRDDDKFDPSRGANYLFPRVHVLQVSTATPENRNCGQKQGLEAKTGFLLRLASQLQDQFPQIALRGVWPLGLGIRCQDASTSSKLHSSVVASRHRGNDLCGQVTALLPAVPCAAGCPSALPLPAANEAQSRLMMPCIMSRWRPA